MPLFGLRCERRGFEGRDADSHAEFEAPSPALMYRSERIVLRAGPSNGRYNKAFLGWSRVYSIARTRFFAARLTLRQDACPAPAPQGCARVAPASTESLSHQGRPAH